MKRNLLYLVFLLSCTFLRAQDVTMLVVTNINGDADYIQLSKVPSISFEKVGEVYKVNINEENGLGFYTYTMDDIKDITFSSGTSGIIDNYATQPRFTFKFEGGTVHVEGVSNQDKISISTIEGAQYQTNITRGEGSADIFFQTAPKGIYMVNISNKQSFKIKIQ